MEIEDNAARQPQKQTSRFASTITELCTGFETSKKKIEELGKQVNDLEDQIQKWKDKEVSWDEMRVEIERERDRAKYEALQAVNEKRDLELRLEQAAKQQQQATQGGCRLL